jgi:hypothetical protein
MSCHVAMVKPARCHRQIQHHRRVSAKLIRDKLAYRRIDPCHHWQNRLKTDHYFDWEIITMNANIGVLLVIGFPLALLACLWLFGKVSVRPE